MGCYDIIWFRCPKCGEKIEAQSKSGDCNFDEYNIEDVPSDVAEDANRHAPFTCPECRTRWKFNITLGLERLPFFTF